MKPQVNSAFSGIHWARQCNLARREKSLLLTLAIYAGKDGRCFPSQATLARDQGVSVDTVQRAALELERRGFIARSHRGIGGGGRFADEYHLLMRDENRTTAAFDATDESRNQHERKPQPARTKAAVVRSTVELPLTASDCHPPTPRAGGLAGEVASQSTQSSKVDPFAGSLFEGIDDDSPAEPTSAEAAAPVVDPAPATDPVLVAPAPAAKREPRKSRKAVAVVDEATLLAARDAYNVAAAAQGFTRCVVLTDKLRDRLSARLLDIGGGDPALGLAHFREALSAIARDEFLSGRIPSKTGKQPFRMDLERLLQTDGGLGDVLARLINLGSTPHISAYTQIWPSSDEAWSELILKNANGHWPEHILGAPIGFPGSQAPPHVVKALGLDGAYREHGLPVKSHPFHTKPKEHAQ